MNASSKLLALVTSGLLGTLAPLSADTTSDTPFRWDDHYDIVNVPNPELVDPQYGGLDLNADGEIVACFHRGEVMIYNPTTNKWRDFAYGLHEPLGIHVEKEGTILVVQRGEITRLHDENGDGMADYYEVVCNDWGMTGNYHEFDFGLVKDSKGNIYISLGTASNGSGVREEIRGTWNETGGLKHDAFLYGGKHGGWMEKKPGTPRMYARVPYRGCVLQIKPGSTKAHVYATGLRTPNGLYMDEDDQLWVTDNQGDWVGASKLHRIQKGAFHGHAASLLWDKNPPNVIPSHLPVEELERRRTKSAALLPQGDCANSVTQMLGYKSSFGAPSAIDNRSLIIGEMNHSRIVQYLPDMVNGQHQGAATHLLNTESLGMGNNRLVYTPDGKSLFVGKTHLSWPGREGIKKVTFKNKPFLQAQSVKLTPDGFQFTFNADIEASVDPADYLTESYWVSYHVNYGSRKNDQKTVTCKEVKIDGSVLTLILAEKPEANRVYDITLPGSISSELSGISSKRFWYTAHKVH